MFAVKLNDDEWLFLADRNDANHAAGGRSHMPASTIADECRERYTDDGKLPIIEIDDEAFAALVSQN